MTAVPARQADVPDSVNLNRYKVIVVPPLYITSNELLNRLVKYVQNSGYLGAHFQERLLQSILDSTGNHGAGSVTASGRYQEFSSLKTPPTLKGDPFQVGEQNSVSDWAEMLLLDGAKPLAFYDHSFFGEYPAITENRYGSGMLTYEGTVLSDALQTKVVERVLTQAGLTGPDRKQTATVRESRASSSRSSPAFSTSCHHR